MLSLARLLLKHISLYFNSKLRYSKVPYRVQPESRFILNARKRLTPTQQLGTTCFRTGRISALKVPSAQNARGYCLDILIESLVVGERVALLDKSG